MWQSVLKKSRAEQALGFCQVLDACSLSADIPPFLASLREVMSCWSARNVAVSLLQNRSGQSQVVVGILLSSEDRLWSVAVHTSVAKGRAYSTASGLEFVAVEVPEDQLVESMPSQIGELVGQADVEGVVGLEGWQENLSMVMGEVTEAWSLH